MNQRYFCPAEYTLNRNTKITKKLPKLSYFRVRFGVRVRDGFWVSLRFCLSGVLRWVEVSLAHFSGRSRLAAILEMGLVDTLHY